ncbi:MAG: 3-dehydroquinate synthase [Muribaculaceae bacterium]|nr:3-dehydroquinate synthase [Muribaculaceae bacterium]
MEQKIIFTNHVGESIDDIVGQLGSPAVFVLCDVNTQSFVLPVLQAQSGTVAAAKIISTRAGDASKDIEALASLWKSLSDLGATRQSVLINIGGGVVTDLGGFGAATFKRGMHFINVPTTLLGAVDAAVGGKTSVNFNGLKNEIGVFANADAVIISTCFFNTLPQQQLLSGYAEMIKHALLQSKDMLDRLLAYSVVYPLFDSEALLGLLEESVAVKQNIVAQDLTEIGLRRALNLGHTAGHAIEAMALKYQSPVPHGYAVAWGLVVCLVLSHMELGFPSETLHKIAAYVLENYGAHSITCKEYPELISLMRHDKKNPSPDSISFTLLKDIGQPVCGCVVSEEKIEAALDIYRDLMHI